jgi:hypothetical protein
MDRNFNAPPLTTIYCQRTGTLFDVANPDPTKVRVADLAWNLSGVKRYGAALLQHYDVAQHSLHVATRLPRRLHLAGLLHDGAEAYLGDVPTYVKRMLGEYVRLEAAVQWAIEAAFELELSDADRTLIHQVDVAIRMDEMAVLCPEHPRFDPRRVTGAKPIRPLERAESNRMYMYFAGRLLQANHRAMWEKHFG